MSRFTDKALTKIAKLTPDEIIRILQAQNREVDYRTTVLDSAEMGYLLTDRNAQVLYFNSPVYTLADCYRKKSSGGFHLSRLFKDKNVCSYIQECIKSNQDEEYQYIHENSMYGRMDIRIYPVKVNEQGLRLFCFQDVTFIKKIREEYLKNESLAAMTTMAAGIAHEIKNPLASISIYIQLLQKQLEKNGSISREEASNSLSIISDEIERLNSITVDFLFAVKPINLKTRISSVNDVVVKTCKVAEPELEAGGIRLETDLATSLPKAELDPNLIEQSLLNLIRNAMQAIGPERKDGIVTVHTSTDGDKIHIDVQDNGCGMTDQQLEKIFEPYYSTKENGTGLGLTNIFKIVKLHNGEISVRSEVNAGTTFTISLPVPKSERYRLSAQGGR